MFPGYEDMSCYIPNSISASGRNFGVAQQLTSSLDLILLNVTLRKALESVNLIEEVIKSLEVTADDVNISVGYDTSSEYVIYPSVWGDEYGKGMSFL
jgi:hypothetical protein